jgi:hypothetical protein
MTDMGAGIGKLNYIKKIVRVAIFFSKNQFRDPASQGRP